MQLWSGQAAALSKAEPAAEKAVRLMRETVGPDIGVKASGGVRTLAQAEAMVAAGATRLGVSGSRALLAGEGAGPGY